jgi:hypothetical protein
MSAPFAPSPSAGASGSPAPDAFHRPSGAAAAGRSATSAPPQPLAIDPEWPLLVEGFEAGLVPDTSPLASPALAAIIRARLDQIEVHGHCASADDAIGAHALASMARAKMLHTANQLMKAADREQQPAIDQLMARPDCLSATERKVITRRLAVAAALNWAAMDVITRWSEPAA